MLLGVWQTLRFLFARVTRAPVFSAQIPRVAHPLVVRFNNSDIVVLLGVFLHGDCHLKLTPPPALILDLGANIGLTATAFALQFPSARIIAVEPDAATMQLCEINTRTHPRTLCLRRIIGDQPGWGRVTNPEAISMAKQYAATREGDSSATPIRTIDELLDEYSSHGPVLVKMDIEGAEIEIFRRPGKWLTRVHAVLVEPHGNGTAQLIRETLARHDFTISEIGEKILGLRAPWL
jgi:FkbM family methyltransferase